MAEFALEIPTPRWAVPLLEPKRYKGVKGGRGSGKSHERAEALIEAHVMNPRLNSVCIREIQKSLKFSAKKLIEDKIHALKLSHLFDITLTEIRRKGGGVMIFQGMQDHTADSIKSLEGFDIAWVEEAQSISARSMELLLPTIRAEGSEVWFSWNPDQEDDPVEQLFRDCGDDAICVHVNYDQNPHCPETLKAEAERHRRRSPDTFDHVWLGAYNTKSDDQVLCGVWKVAEQDLSGFDGPYFGADWGFSTDPNTLVEVWIDHERRRLHVESEQYAHGVEIDDTPAFFAKMPESKRHTIRCDSARPEIISYMQRHGYNTIAAKKWPGSVEDGISFLRSFDITINPACQKAAEEARLWKYKRNRAGDVLPQLASGNDHVWDAVRYAVEPFINNKTDFFVG